MKNQVMLSIDELKDISDILSKLDIPEYTPISIKESKNTGIGSNLYIEVPLVVKEVNGKFIIEIRGVDKW